MEIENKALPLSSGLKTIQLNDGKAGMQGLDKDLINRIIYETSKGTPYFTFQEKRQKSIDSKVEEFKSILKRVTDKERGTALIKMEQLGVSLEAERDLSHSIVHIDMDAFYAAVEMLDNPRLMGKPVAVGTMGMLSTSNYEARKYGVRAAMPGFIAKKLCPHLVIVPCNFTRYREVSNQVREIVREYDPNYCPASLDEMYLDLTEYIKDLYRLGLHRDLCLKRRTPSEAAANSVADSADSYKMCTECCQPLGDEKRDLLAYNVVKEIRERISLTTRLTASAGIAPNVMLAKVCSDRNKPNGQYQILSNVKEVKSFTDSLRVEKVSGIGPVQGQILNALGIHTCSNIWEKRDVVACLFTSTSSDFYMRVAKGIGSTTVKSDYVRKSIGTEQTFKDTHDREELLIKCRKLCEEAVEELQLHNMVGKVIVLKLKTTHFETRTRNQSLSCHSSDKEVFWSAARKLLDFEIATLAPKPLCLRLMGIRIANLIYEDSISSSDRQIVKLKDYLKLKLPNHEKNPIKPHSSTGPGEYSIHGPPTPEEDCRLVELSSFDGETCYNEDVSYICPVCDIRQNVKSLSEFNSHIDHCLNRSTIKEILTEDLHKTKRRQQCDKQNSKKTKFHNRTEKKIEEYFH